MHPRLCCLLLILNQRSGLTGRAHGLSNIVLANGTGSLLRSQPSLDTLLVEIVPTRQLHHPRLAHCELLQADDTLVRRHPYLVGMCGRRLGRVFQSSSSRRGGFYTFQNSRRRVVALCFAPYSRRMDSLAHPDSDRKLFNSSLGGTSSQLCKVSMHRYHEIND